MYFRYTLRPRLRNCPWKQRQRQKVLHVGWNNFKQQYRLRAGWLGVTPAEKDLGCWWTRSWTWVCQPALQWQMPTAQWAALARTQWTVWASWSPPLFCTCEEYVSGVLCWVLSFPVQEVVNELKQVHQRPTEMVRDQRIWCTRWGSRSWALFICKKRRLRGIRLIFSTT